ncbi:EAL domain-containing protein [uncultured Sphingomonas sp.]|uniref:EAL domain-containing protein n=1 Tax=uncultured Sphingomonas sp. TaxID=158754 RepID=UPI0037490EDC
MPDSFAKPLFILSFRQRDELAAMAARAGWRAIAARRDEGLGGRITASGAQVVVIDARGAVEEGLAAVRAIGDAAEAAGQALLVMVSRNDVDALDAAREAGATHFLVSPVTETEFAQALRFAERFADRVSGGRPVREARWVAPLGWRYDHVRRSLQVTTELARLAGVAEEGPASAAWLRQPGDVRARLRNALRRLKLSESTAFAHDLPGLGRVVAHLQRDPHTGRLHGLVEPIGEPDAGAAVRDLFGRRSRSMAALARELPSALKAGEIDVVFQPQVDLASGRITGVEALARWHHRRLGEVGAEALLTAAAQGGRSEEVSAHLQARALQLAAGWPAALEKIRVAVNVAAEDIAADGFVFRLLERIDASGIARDRVTVEVTESGLIERLDVAAALLAELRTAGCRIAIDDFGTGYSSLAYLNALPVDYLKLDKSLTTGITGNARDRVVVRGVIDMATTLGLDVIAEGVETAEQRDLLAAAGCRFYQGYLCAPGVDSATLAALVQAT